MDDEENCLIETIEGIPCWNEEINAINIAFESEGEVMLLSEFNDTIDSCGWFKKALSFIKKNAVAIAVTAVVVAAVVTVAVAAPVFVTTVATAVMSSGGGAAALAGGISAGLAAAGSAVASSTLIPAAAATAAIAVGVAATADMIDAIEWEGVKYKVRELTEQVRYSIRNSQYYLAVATSEGKMFVSSIPVSHFIAMTAARAGLSVYTYYQNNALSLATVVNYNYYPQRSPAHKNGYFEHYHVYKANQTCHIFFGDPVWDEKRLEPAKDW